ncbi:MAG: hypothetical protein OQL06_15390 [Gammaproteobacteria bacterium]|nr:hypothetical protein [Gammaproteobacteria bacterium]
MSFKHISKRYYAGLERRSTRERRISRDRRNLMRFDSLGSERRDGLYRRYEDLQWNTTIQR